MNAKEYEFLVGKHDVSEHRLNSSVEYRRTKREINRFCKGLSLDTKQYLPEKTIQGVEKEYVSILGIFASIILAFVGGMTFSTSVLNNIAKASIFRLLIVTDLLAFVLFNTIIILLKFIFVINDSRQNFPFSAKFMNIILLIFALFILISWCFSLNDIPSFLLKFFPWGH